MEGGGPRFLDCPCDADVAALLGLSARDAACVTDGAIEVLEEA